MASDEASAGRCESDRFAPAVSLFALRATALNRVRLSFVKVGMTRNDQPHLQATDHD